MTHGAEQVGTIVHYVSYGTPGGEYPQKCRAAIITDLHQDFPERRSLCVLNPTGTFFNTGVRHSFDKSNGGTWHNIEECKS